MMSPPHGCAVSRVLTAATAALIVLCSAGVHATEKAKPDIDGVWLGISIGGQLGPGVAADKLTPAAKQAQAAFKEMYGPEIPEAGSYCVHSGMPSMMTSAAGYPLEIISNKKQINITVETGSFRRIFMDGRKHPTDRPPTATGYSVGRWEGDVLVVETKNLAERVDSRVISEQAHIIERIYLKDDTGETRGGIAETMQTERNGKMLVDEITLIDPKFYTEPQKYVGYFRRAPDSAVLEYDCGREFWEAALDAIVEKKKH